MIEKLNVRRGPEGWVVEIGTERFQFASGAGAEAWARERARELAALGAAVELTIMDLKGGLAGVISFSPLCVAAA